MNEENSNDIVQVEISLVQPTQKKKIKKNLYEIFCDLDINDETDLDSISYVVDKQNQLVHKIIVCFKSKQNAEKFNEFLTDDGNSPKYDVSEIIINNVNYSSKNRRRLSTSSSDSLYIIPDERLLSIDQNLSIVTSFYGSKLQDSLIQSSKEDTINRSLNDISNITITDYNEDTNREKDDTTNDTIVEFYSDREISDSNLEILMLFLENKKQYGGGDWIERNLDEKKRILTVKYELDATKKRILERHVFNFKINGEEFKLIANEPMNKSKYKPDGKMIILRNIKNGIDEEIIRIFAENLVVNDDEDNDVEEIMPSSIFKNTFYVKYKLEFNLEKLKKRLEKRPKLDNSKVELMEALKTNIVLVKQFDKVGQNIPKDLIEMYFLNKKRCGAEQFSSLYEREPYLLINYDNHEDVEKILRKKHEVPKHELIVEGLFNFDLLEEELKKYDNQGKNSKENKNESEENLTEKNKHENQYKDDTEKSTNQREEFENKTEEPIKEEVIVKHPQPIVKLNIRQQEKLKIFYDFDQTIFDQFKSELLERQSDVIKEDENEQEIKIVCNHDLPSNPNEYQQVKKKWEKDIIMFIKEYFEQYEIRIIKIKNPQETLKKLDNDPLRIMFKKLDDNKSDSSYEVIGFKEEIKKAITDIEHQNKLQEELDNLVIEDKIEGLKLYQIRVLFVNKYIKTMKDKYPDISIVINPRQFVVTLKGTRSQVEYAKEFANNILNSIQCLKKPVEKLITTLFEQKEIDIVNWLRENNVSCALIADSQLDLINIYSTNKNELEKCSKLISSEIKIQDIDPNLIEDVDEDKIMKFIDQNSDESGLIIEFKNGNLRICGFNEDVIKVFNDFLESVL